MANPIRSIDLGLNSKGQLKLALFLAICSPAAGYTQIQLQVGHEQFASAGFLKPDHWLDESLGQHNQTHWLAYQISASSTYQRDNLRLGIARENQAYARANTSALLLAAQDKARDEVDLSTTGRFPLGAEVWKLNTTTFFVAWTWQPTVNFSVEIEPFLQTIHDFEYMRGDLLLTNDGHQSQLTGQIRKIGTRSYGFLTQDQPDRGWGSGLNLRSQFNSPWGMFRLTVRNAWNQQRFSVVHRSDSQYNVTASGNKIRIADLPSITAQYGVTEGKKQLPAFWQLTYEPTQISGLIVGAMGLGEQAAWTAGYSGAWAEGRWWIHTTETRNWTAGYGRSWGHGWKAFLGVSADERAKSPLLSFMQISKQW